jgi:copper chaperone NosL
METKEESMKKSLISAAILICSLAALAATVADDIARFQTCSICGMDRGMFNFSRIYYEYDDASAGGVCSMHCLAVVLANDLNRVPKDILVADYGTKALIDADTAVWVMGGKKQGVMTRRAKWAFRDQRAAEAFIKENDGLITSFDEVMKASYEDMYADNSMIRERRAAKMKEAGKMKP